MFEAVISDPEILKTCISVISDIVNEGSFNIKKSGIYFTAADISMVVVVDLKLLETYFDEYNIDEETTIGIDISSLSSILKRVKNKDKIILSLKNDNKLNISVKNFSTRTFSLPLITVEKKDIPDISDFCANIDIKTSVIDDGISDAEIVADSITFKADKNSFEMNSFGDVTSTKLKLDKNSEAIKKFSVNNETKSNYSTEYLRKIMKTGKLCDTFSLGFGSEYPIKMIFKVIDKVQLSFLLAPRVSER